MIHLNFTELRAIRNPEQVVKALQEKEILLEAPKDVFCATDGEFIQTELTVEASWDAFIRLIWDVDADCTKSP